MKIKLTEDTEGQRLDQALRHHFPQWGRKEIGRAISMRRVKVNGKVVWLASWKVFRGDTIETEVPADVKPVPTASFDPAWLIADDGDIVAINKPAGLLSAPSRSVHAVNLHDLAKAHFGELLLFHRLDRDTSGVVLLTRPGRINKLLDKAFKTREVTKEYRAAVAWPHHLKPEGVIEARLGMDPARRDQMVVVAVGGQHAVTRYELIPNMTGRNVQHVRLWPETGRTHQLRVHLAHLGSPILGDRLYGNVHSAKRLMLHAHRLELPALGEKPARTYLAPLPAGFE
ncbi:MAG: RluA family pseudouridine synthase [Gemmatales bacterium]